MPLNPQLKAVLDRMPVLAPINTVTPQEARTRMVVPLPPPDVEPVARTENLSATGSGGDIPVRVYTPAGSGPFGAVVFYHGGGWVLGTLDGSELLCRGLANASGCVVVSVDYRLAPEHRFPAAAEDSYAALEWTAANASRLGVDGSRLAVAGVSAGGNLAAAVTLMARDRKGPSIRFQFLVVPVTRRDFSTSSYSENAAGPQLTKDAMVWFWDQYLRNAGDAANPYAAPLVASDFANLPPALIYTAEYDPLRDEGRAYAEALSAAGVPVVYRCHEGMTHGFLGLFTQVDASRSALNDAGVAIRAALGRRQAVS